MIPPSEREWTVEEQDAFYKDIDASVKNAVEGNFTSVANAPVTTPNEPLTLDHLLKMKADMDAKIAEHVHTKFKDGADMSRETWDHIKLGITPRKTDGSLFFNSTIATINIHFRNDIPYGEIRECTCWGQKIEAVATNIGSPDSGREK